MSSPHVFRQDRLAGKHGIEATDEQVVPVSLIELAAVT